MSDRFAERRSQRVTCLRIFALYPGILPRICWRYLRWYKQLLAKLIQWCTYLRRFNLWRTFHPELLAGIPTEKSCSRPDSKYAEVTYKLTLITRDSFLWVAWDREPLWTNWVKTWESISRSESLSRIPGLCSWCCCWLACFEPYDEPTVYRLSVSCPAFSDLPIQVSGILYGHLTWHARQAWCWNEIACEWSHENNQADNRHRQRATHRV